MSDVYSFETGRKQLTPEQLLANATEDGQDKVVITSLRDDGEVGVWASDGITPADMLYMTTVAKDFAGGEAIRCRNTKEYDAGYEE